MDRGSFSIIRNTGHTLPARPLAKYDLWLQGESDTSCELSWIEDHLVSAETQAKVQALKMMVRWLLGIKSNDNNVATSTLRLLSTMLTHDGDLMEKGKIK